MQLEKLDYQWDALAKLPNPPTRIDLSLGSQVPVMFEASVAAKTGGTVATKPAAAPTQFFVFPNSSAKTKREL